MTRFMPKTQHMIGSGVLFGYSSCMSAAECHKARLPKLRAVCLCIVGLETTARVHHCCSNAAIFRELKKDEYRGLENRFRIGNTSR